MFAVGLVSRVTIEWHCDSGSETTALSNTAVGTISTLGGTLEH
jgi:hypothetical protein